MLGALALTLPVAALAMGSHLPGLPSPWIHALHQPWSLWIQALLTTLIVFLCGWPLLLKGAQSWSRRLNMFTLISMGILITWAYSLLALLAPGLFPPSFHQHGGVPVYFEAAAMITALVLLGQWIEKRAQGKTGHAIQALLSLTPPLAHRIQPDGHIQDISPADIQPGDLLLVRPGGTIPADGCITHGQSHIDESMITGEPLPRHRAPGDPVTAGTINGHGAFHFRAERVGSQTLLARIIRRVQQAQESRAPIQRIADRVVGYVVPVVLLLAAATFFLWYVLGPEPRLLYALINAVTVLMITCPCALGLATPMSIVVAMGHAARHGILIRDAATLERLSTIDTILFDKTGTLTQGQPRLISLHPISDLHEKDLLQLAASVEQSSEHPLAHAIRSASTPRNLPLLPVHDVHAHPGRGIQATHQNHTLRIGHPRWLAEHHIPLPPDLTSLAHRAETQGQTVVWVARDTHCLGFLVIADPLRPTTSEALHRFHRDGKTCIMLTGDAEPTARHIALQLGIANVHAALLPEQKQDIIHHLKQQGHTVAMIGDGINDAPALAAAHIGIAVGTATSVAIETADITLLDGDLNRAAHAFTLGRATLRNIRQNLAFAFLYNAIAIPVAAGALYPLTGLLLTPALASLAMTLSSLSVITNALRLRNTNIPQQPLP